MPWRYRIETPFEIVADELSAVSFDNQWLSIRNKMLSIQPGYAWDGCSPTLKLPVGLWLGPWDGPLRPDGRPAAWRASLVHDALCQFRRELRGVSKPATVVIFARLLREDGAPDWMCRLYPAAIDRFGPQGWLG